MTLTLTTATACGPRSATSAAVRVRVEPVVRVDAGPSQTIMASEQVPLLGTASGAYPVQWTPATGLSNPTLLQPLAAPTATTTYTLSAGAGRCATQSQTTVTVTPLLRIPSAFSPNGDGNDDTWQLDGVAAYPGSRVLIFNRWGTRLFEASD
ncbi:MAG: gliding motility-associated C-terminal domain-containing protein [Janthinobacterium lividum]